MSLAAQSRREALRRAALGAGALAATTALRPATAFAQAEADEDLRDFLVEAIGLEQVTVLAYTLAAEVEDLDNSIRQDLETFRGHEQAHANALRQALDELGYDSPEPPDSATDGAVFDDVEGLDSEQASRLTELLTALEELERGDDALRYLQRLEDEQLDLYLGSGPALDSEDLATTCAEIAGCQSQHLLVLAQTLADPPADALAVAYGAIEQAPGVEE